jgi:protoporphyrinogen oxidase
MRDRPRIIVIGAGPTGIGAAWRLHELGHPDWCMIDAAPEGGGLASSVVDDEGFTWDLGGHVLFSHYRYFDRLMDQALGERWVEHIREAWVWMRERWIPYPFQNNIWRLPQDDLLACLDGLLEVHRTEFSARPETFREWLLQSFGAGLCDTFMFPYNFKVWAYPPEAMDTGWMGERVARVDLSRVLHNLVQQRNDVGWGPNATFRFPALGGTGAIWKALCAQLPPERLRFGARVCGIDPIARRVILQDGQTLAYDRLVSSMPLDQLLGMLAGQSELKTYIPEFVHSSTHVVGIGLDGPVPESLATKCWMYFPESLSPFYRVTVFSNYAPANVPQPGNQWSLMAEVSESPAKPVESDRVVGETVAGLRACRLIADESRIVSRWHRRLEYGYPTPWHGRDRVLDPVDTALCELGIYSRGRFGAWKYEVSNQDHSVMQGVEVIDHILDGRQERTYHGDMSDKPR